MPSRVVRYAQADLCFLLPLRAGQCAAIFGSAPYLASAVASEDVKTLQVIPVRNANVPPDEDDAIWYRDLTADSRKCLASASLDHVFILEPGNTCPRALLAEVARLLKPGGWFFLGVQNTERLHRFRMADSRRGRSIERDKRLSLSLRRCRSLLKQNNLVFVETYGIHADLDEPRYLVPLESAAVARHFFAQMFAPVTPSASLIWRFAPLLATIGLQRILFRDLGIIARRAFDSAHASGLAQPPSR